MDVCVQYSPMMVRPGNRSRDSPPAARCPEAGLDGRAGVNRLCWRAPNVRTPPLTTIPADDGVAGLSADPLQGPHAASPEVRTVQLTMTRTTVA
jgi:hypothetical protein